MKAVAVFAVLLVVLAPEPVAARQADARSWTFDGELGASLFFGASRQTAVLSRGKVEVEDPRWELTLGGAFDYGEAQDPNDGRFVNKRAWSSVLSVDWLPSGRFSPFVFATAEGSLQRQIDTRVSGGAGGRYRFVDTEGTRIDLSIAALAERTDSRRAVPGASGVTSIGRWSARFRARHSFSENRVRFDLVTFYKPRMDAFENYTVELTSSLQYALTSIIGLKVSLVDTYDSQARGRGALSNNDGQLFFSVAASIR